LATTIFGFITTDAWKALKHGASDAKLTEMSIVQFADCLAYNCINNKLPEESPKAHALNLEIQEEDDHPLSVNVDAAAPHLTTISPISVARSSLEDLSVKHPRMVNPELVGNFSAVWKVVNTMLFPVLKLRRILHKNMLFKRLILSFTNPCTSISSP
jgi:hypothetical protein